MPPAALSAIPGPRAASRYDRLDALRGLALVWMAVFHFCFDLATFRLIDANFYADPLWTTQRTAILSLFLLCAGAGQAVAAAQQQSWPRFWRRWAQIAGCALLVSAGSALMFPRSWISFGVLHGMALMLIAARLLAPLRGWLWPLGLAIVLLPQWVAHPFFDSRWTNWVGLVTHKPVTEDYVPIFPWFGVMLWGMAATQVLLARAPGWFTGPLPRPGAPLTGLAVLGRWSLSFYMVHQPVFIGALMLATQLR